jgi:hypothetical protein
MTDDFVAGAPNVPDCDADPAHCKGGHWGAGGYWHFAPIPPSTEGAGEETVEESLTESTISGSELGERLRALAQAVDHRTPLFADDEPQAPKTAPLSSDERWQVVEDMAYAIDAEPEKEAAWLWATRECFRGCDPQTDWPGYVVCHLLESLLANRGHKLRRECPAAVSTTGVRGPNADC